MLFFSCQYCMHDYDVGLCVTYDFDGNMCIVDPHSSLEL